MTFKLFINKGLHLFEVRRVKTSKKEVFLTFDDGPEGEITDFVLDELKKYNAKATFFCKGENVIRNRIQYDRIVREGHAVGNHTFSHINSFHTKTNDYVNDVLKADKVIHSSLFRPPWGSMTLGAYLRLCRKFKIVYWSLISGDTKGNHLDINKCMARLTKNTRKGDVILFHSCYEHENETRKILPRYLLWLKQEKYECNVLTY